MCVFLGMVRRRLWSSRNRGRAAVAVALTLLFALGMTTSRATAVELAPAKPAADDAQSVSLSVLRFGIDGHFKVGEPVTVHLRIQGRSTGPLYIRTQTLDPDDRLVSARYGPYEQLGATPPSPKVIVRPGKLRGVCEFILETGQGERLATTSYNWSNALTLGTPLWVTLGRPSGWLALRKEAEKKHAPQIPVVVELDDWSELPDTRAGLQSVDAVIVNVASAGQSDLLNAQTEQALKAWVATGGNLVVAVGAATDEFTRQGWSKWIPVGVEPKAVPIRRLSGIEAYSGQSKPLPFTEVLHGAALSAHPAAVLVTGQNSPLVVRQPVGFGRVTVVAVDLHRPPFTEWDGAAAFAGKLTDFTLDVTDSVATSELAQPGISDLTTQLRSALEVFDDVRPPPFWMFMLGLLGYVLLVGPLDYWLTHRVLRRPEWTWFSFPVWVLLVLVGTATCAQSSFGGRRDHRQLSIVDMHLGADVVRGWSWISVFSPETRRYDIACSPEPALLRLAGDAAAEPATAIKTRKGEPSWIAFPETALHWVAVPENTVGGLYRSGGLHIGTRAYEEEVTAARVAGLPVTQWSTVCLNAEWLLEASLPCSADLRSGGVGIEGTFAHRFASPLEECVLMHGGRVYFPNEARRLETGAVWEPGLSPSDDLHGFLTRKKSVMEKRESTILKPEPYDPLKKDLSDIVRFLSFHRFAGGTSYTGLNHDLFRRGELSGMVSLGEAVLLARIDARATRLTIDGIAPTVPRESTYLRIVIPVTRVRQDTFNMPPKKSGG